MKPAGLFLEFVAESISTGDGQVFWLELDGCPYAAVRIFAVNMIHHGKPLAKSK